MVNLARRPDRRVRISGILDELGYNYTIFNAVDGRYIQCHVHTICDTNFCSPLFCKCII